ncbi:MAG: hypothetical protein DHS20C11_21520 [Lysobacteraceae bacterium]|nr:MAG: hypothetical protein DHS20C11_21520 [Xanthomonadaceae bacterium]
MNISALLAKPFPQEESIGQTLAIAVSISLFVVVFLYVFEPFGVHQLEGLTQLYVCLGFGATTLLASITYEAISRLTRLKVVGARFTFGRWLVYLFFALLFISLANFLFVRLALFGDIQWALFPYMIRGTFAVGFFPTAAIATVALLRQEKKNKAIASDYTPSKNVDRSPSNASLFGISENQIRYVQALQNYVTIVYVDDNLTMKKSIERSTLQGIAEQADSGSLIRCHRSFLVNMDHIASISGNAQGLLLALNDCDEPIPVSRRYIDLFRGPN